METLKNSVELLLKLAVAISAIGYVALRAYYNFLGVPFTHPFGVERYLMEVYALLSFVFRWVAQLVLPVVMMAILAAATWGYLVPARLKSLIWKGARPVWLLRQVGCSLVTPAALIFAASALSFWSLLLLPDCKNGVLVGAIDPCLAELPSVEGRNFLVSVLAFLFSVSLFRRVQATAVGEEGRAFSGAQILLWRAVALALLLLSYEAVLIYAVLVHSNDYSTVLIESSTKEQTCGILIGQPPSGLIVWQALGGIGQFVTIPYSKADRIVSGEVRDLLETARTAAASRGAFPVCEELTLQFEQEEQH